MSKVTFQILKIGSREKNTQSIRSLNWKYTVILWKANDLWMKAYDLRTESIRSFNRKFAIILRKVNGLDCKYTICWNIRSFDFESKRTFRIFSKWSLIFANDCILPVNDRIRSARIIYFQSRSYTVYRIRLIVYLTWS